jgi:hypothetical protein
MRGSTFTKEPQMTEEGATCQNFRRQGVVIAASCSNFKNKTGVQWTRAKAAA